VFDGTQPLNLADQGQVVNSRGNPCGVQIGRHFGVQVALGPRNWITVVMTCLLSSTPLMAQTTYDQSVVGYAYGSPNAELQFDHLYSRSGDNIELVRLEDGHFRYRCFHVSTIGRYVPLSPPGGPDFL
jgi:hypothetical protein